MSIERNARTVLNERSKSHEDRFFYDLRIACKGHDACARRLHRLLWKAVGDFRQQGHAVSLEALDERARTHEAGRRVVAAVGTTILLGPLHAAAMCNN